MNRNFWRTTAPTALALSVALGLSACGAANEDTAAGSTGGSGALSGTLNAAGSSAQEAAVSSWQKAFQSANPDVTVNYDPVGSGGGREQFIAGGIQLAGSDAYLTDDELSQAKSQCKSDVIEVPVYVSPIAIVYNLPGVDQLNLTADTIGAIFAGDITSWDDPKIAADNPDAKLPSTAITPVHRSDDSGTTENFTDYLDQASGGSWTGGVVQTWPFKSGEGAEGTSGVIASVKGGEGTIGYADASQAGDLGTADVKIGDAFTPVSAEGATAVLDESKVVSGRAASDIAISVNRTTTASNAYPIILISYQIACQQYPDAETADLVKGWLTYVTSTDGQQAAAKGAGSAPLSSKLVGQVAPIVSKISAAS